MRRNLELKGKQVVVAGLGKSGAACARFLASQGARVIATDIRPPEALENITAELSGLGVRVVAGSHEAADFTHADLIVLSPGVPHDIEPVDLARKKGVMVIGEIELAFWFLKKPILAITGTNGKSTVTLLVSEMLRRSGKTVLTGGNLGTPLVEFIGQEAGVGVIVAEISSFQLDTIGSFRPWISVILNITDDHLERYADFDAYARSKARIFENQGPDDVCVINAGDKAVWAQTQGMVPRCFAYNTKTLGEARAWIEGNAVCFHVPNLGDRSVDCGEIPLKGVHNLENIAAAGLAAVAAGGDFEGIEAALKHFKGLPHRVEYVDTVKGVLYFDDSKGTNVDAVVRALEGFTRPVVLIMGGRDKGGGYEALIPGMSRCVKQLIVLGEAAQRIEKAFRGLLPVTWVPNMAAAVRLASETAAPGDAVLLSPACSSFDMYSSYAERGADFVRCVAGLERG